MQPGKILVAEHEGVNIIKLVGDVRLTLCMSFDQFIESMFSRENFVSILFDLTQAEAIDSTTFGLMAKLSIFSRERHHVTPVVISTSTSINRLLEIMGLEDIFDILHEIPEAMYSPTQELPSVAVDEGDAKNKVLEAHRILMDMNEKNKETFRDLVNILENDKPVTGIKNREIGIKAGIRHKH